MLNTIKAALFRCCELSWESLTKFKAWIKMSAPFNSFDMENFNSPTLRIAQATNEQGEPLAFCPVETCFLISAYAVSPTATPLQARAAGDEIDAEIARFAQRNGITKLLLIVPKDYPALPEDEYKQVRVYERKIADPINLQGLGLPSTAQVAGYVN